MPPELNTALPKDVIVRRRKKLGEIGFSPDNIKAISAHAETLCGCEHMTLRMNNLRKLGFNPKTLIAKNPTMLNRSPLHVTKRFYVIQTWFTLLDINVDVHNLFMCRPQLWSASHHKLITLFLLVFKMEDVTPRRICNFITLNLENVLLMYMEGYHEFMDLACQVRGCAGEKSVEEDLKQKRQFISDGHESLPEDVFKYYKKHFLK